MKSASKKKMPDKKPAAPLFSRLCARLDIPADLTAGGLRLDLRGRRNLTVHGCRRILSVSPTAVCLALPAETLTVCGEGLICTAYLAGAVGVEGRIDTLCFKSLVSEEESQ